MGKKRMVVSWVLWVLALVTPRVVWSADPNLLALYWLDTGEGSQVWDETGNGRNGVMNGAVSWLPNGVIGGGLQFSGGSVDITGNVDTLQFGDRDVTVTAWIKTGARDHAFFSKVTSGAGFNYAFGVGTYGGNGFATMANKNRASINSTTAVDDNEWHHVAFVQDRVDVTFEEKWSLYVDGLMESSYLTDIGADNGQGGMHLGLADVGGGFNNNYNGALDELYIYGSALDDSDMSFVMDGATWNPRARDPQPADGIILSGTSVNLAWSAGWADTALGEHLAPDSHTVYLSQNLDAVLEGRAEAILDSTMETILAVADLEIDTVYYWRVDEVNDTDTDSPWTGQVWSFQVPALAAKDPVPVDGAQFQALTTILRWTSGIGAKSHVVYMGRTYDEVADATSGGVAVTEPAYAPQGLQSDKIYYWRVDEVNSQTVKGPVWKFSTVPVADGEIMDPDLYGWWKLDEGDGSVAVDYSGHGNHGTLKDKPLWVEGTFGGALRTWQGGGIGYVALPNMPDFTPEECTLSGWIFQEQMIQAWSYFFGNRTTEPYGLMQVNGNLRYNWPGGSNAWGYDSGLALPLNEWAFVAVSIKPDQAVLYVNNQTNTRQANHAPGVFTSTNFLGRETTGAPGKAIRGLIDDFRLYSKALNAEDMAQVMRGEPWLAWNPQPGNGVATDVEKASVLRWDAGEGAATHDVYVAMDPDALRNADASDTTGVYRGRQTDVTYSLEGIQASMTYYWRVDEVQADGSIRKGNVWKFTTTAYLIVDDFEGYSANQGQEVWMTWLDGFAEKTLGGSLAGHLDSPYVETTLVHSGSQSLPLYYNNDGGEFTHEDGSVSHPVHSEIVRTFTGTEQDWTRFDVKTLSLYTHGNGSAASFSYNTSANTYTVLGTGNDIWAGVDSFYLIHKTLKGDGSITAKVESVQNSHAWARAGVMIRETLEAGSVHGIAAVTPANGVNFTHREFADGTSFNVQLNGGNDLKAPYWVRLERAGNLLSAYGSVDGKAWVKIGYDASITMANDVLIGLAVNSHAGDRATCETVFSNVTTTGNVSTGAFVLADEVGIPSNGADRFYVAIEDSKGTSVVMDHPDNPNVVLRNAWEPPFEIVLADVAGMGVDLTHVLSLTLGVGQSGGAAGGSGILYVDDIRLYPAPPEEPNEP